MGYLKTLTSKDVIVTPFTVHKQFSYDGTVPSYNEEGVFRGYGYNSSYPNAGGGIGTGSTQLVYNSIKQLYYSNYLENGKNGKVSNVATASFNTDGTITGPRYTPNYINNIQSSEEFRYFPTESFDVGGLGVINYLSIPSKLLGDYIKPGSYSDNNHYDDGQGNLLQSGINVGNIIYKAGLVIITGNIYNGPGSGQFSTFINPQWESSYTLYETQYKCTIRANEFNYSLNPSLLSSSIRGNNEIINSGSAQYSDFVTGSNFSPFVTTIGLYDDNQELLAVAKLAQPLPTSQTTDTTILINLDR